MIWEQKIFTVGGIRNKNVSVVILYISVVVVVHIWRI